MVSAPTVALNKFWVLARPHWTREHGSKFVSSDRHLVSSSDGVAEPSSESVGSRPTSRMRKKRTRTGSKDSNQTKQFSVSEPCFRHISKERRPPPESTAVDKVGQSRARPPLAHERKDEKATRIPLSLLRRNVECYPHTIEATLNKDQGGKVPKHRCSHTPRGPQ